MDSPTKQAIVPAQEYVEILKRVLDMNEQIVRQNTLVIQSVTLPQLMVRPGEWVEVKP
jgi:uncharacterized protein (UPF0216 family)